MKQNLTHPITRRAGFTLVELAIVITIIGILIGGVLKGQQLIDQARLAATINQVNNYHSALMIFKTTYNELPGDMRDPDARIVGCDGCVAVDDSPLGNNFVGQGRLVGDVGNNFDKIEEMTRFWLHLYMAEMISGISDAALDDDSVIGPGTTHPVAKLGGGFVAESSGWPDGGSQCGSDSGYTIWGSDNCLPDPQVVLMIHNFSSLREIWAQNNYRAMSPLEAASIDRKMDDGKPLSGDVRGASLGSFNGCANTDDDYPESDTNSDICTLGFLMGT